MHTVLPRHLAVQYKSPSQRIRIMTESWVDQEIFCPSCGHDLDKYEDNKPVADFQCSRCREDYELKSKKNNFGPRVADGAYKTMIGRLKSDRHPNLFLLSYDLANLRVNDFFVVPKHFFVSEIIEQRNPLGFGARRAGWVGCNILLKNVPASGKIYYVKNRQVVSKKVILDHWVDTLFLRDEKQPHAKTWILDIMNCIDKLDKKEFTLDDMYKFESELQAKHPENKHVKDKIRQQLQFLRDKGYLDFLGRGKYRLRF